MNPKKIVRLSNILGLVSIIGLVYWVFIFILMEVFGLKVFRENLTQTFYMSILGILALMFGSLMINIMFNMTRIAEKHNNDQEPVSRPKKIPLIIFAGSFVLIMIFLFTGDAMTKINREKMLITSAKNFIQLDSSAINHLSNYTFEKDWINRTAEILKFLNKYDSSFRSVNVIVKDRFDSNDVFLSFTAWNNNSDDSKKDPQIIDYVMSTNLVQRAYLSKVFAGETKTPLFSAYDGYYELFYPYTDASRTIVLYFTDQQSYGKMGS